jgi:uncharacterized protein (DUF885 family)
MKHFSLMACMIAAGVGPLWSFQRTRDLNSILDEYIELRIAYDATLAYSMGLPPSDDMHLPDRSASALKAQRLKEDQLLREIRSLGPVASEWVSPSYFVLREDLESREALRVCRTEYWDINHMLGWQVELPALVATLPATTPSEQARILRLLETLPTYLSSDMENLRSGLAEGYSAPRSVVTRVLRQIDALLALPMEKSPFYDPRPAGETNDLLLH